MRHSLSKVQFLMRLKSRWNHLLPNLKCVLKRAPTCHSNTRRRMKVGQRALQLALLWKCSGKVLTSSNAAQKWHVHVTVYITPSRSLALRFFFNFLHSVSSMIWMEAFNLAKSEIIPQRYKTSVIFRHGLMRSSAVWSSTKCCATCNIFYSVPFVHFRVRAYEFMSTLYKLLWRSSR